MNQFDDHQHDHDLDRSPSADSQNSQIEFTQYLRGFSPRSAQLDLAELRAEMIPKEAANPVLFPAQSAASQVSMIHSSWPRVAAAWACGLVMGAAITSLLLGQGDEFRAQAKRGSNEMISLIAESATGRDRDSTMKENSVADPSPVDKSVDRTREMSQTIDLSGCIPASPLVASYYRLKLGIQTDYSRSSLQQVRFEATPRELKGDDLESSTDKVRFETPDRITDRHTLLREFSQTASKPYTGE